MPQIQILEGRVDEALLSTLCRLHLLNKNLQVNHTHIFTVGHCTQSLCLPITVRFLANFTTFNENDCGSSSLNFL